MRFSVKALTEKLGAVHDEATAIINLAEKESRDLTAEEQKLFDEKQAEYKAIKDEQLPKAEWLEAEAARLGERRNALPLPVDIVKREPDGTPSDLAEDRVSIPAGQFRPSNLRAFKGPKAHERAYAAGQFMLAAAGRPESRKWCVENGIIQNALTTGNNPSAGYLVPPQFESTIIDLKEEYGVFARYARPFPMASDTATIPRRSTGVTAYFVGENTAPTESTPAVDQVSVTATKLAVLVTYSTEIAEDAVISIGDWLAREIAYAFAVKEDQCGFVGDGTSTYGGMTGVVNAVAAGSVYTALTGNTAFSTLDLVDFEGMVGKLPMFPGIRPAWFISMPGYAASMMRLADAAGGNTSANLGAGPNGMMFLGYPVVISQVLNSTLSAQTSTTGLALFGDLGQAATLGSRRGVTIATSSEAYFTSDKLAIKGTRRFGINVHERGTASAAGPILALATPGS